MLIKRGDCIHTPHAAPGAPPPPPLPPPPLPSPPLPPSPHGPSPRLEPVVIVTMANTLRRALQLGSGSSTALLVRVLNYFGNARTTTRNYTKQYLNDNLRESYDYYCGSGRGMLQDARHRWRRQGHSSDVCPPLSLLAVLCCGQVADLGGCAEPWWWQQQSSKSISSSPAKG